MIQQEHNAADTRKVQAVPQQIRDQRHAQCNLSNGCLRKCKCHHIKFVFKLAITVQWLLKNSTKSTNTYTFVKVLRICRIRCIGCKKKGRQIRPVDTLRLMMSSSSMFKNCRVPGGRREVTWEERAPQMRKDQPSVLASKPPHSLVLGRRLGSLF